MKRALVFLMAMVMIVSCSTIAFAYHPETVAPGTQGITDNLISIKKPETSNSATLRTVYGITGIGSKGVGVALYKFDGLDYRIMYNESGYRQEGTLGATGIFYRQVNLNEGHNLFMVRAEATDGTYQLVYFDINMLRYDIITNIRAITNSCNFSGWLN